MVVLWEQLIKHVRTNYEYGKAILGKGSWKGSWAFQELFGDAGESLTLKEEKAPSMKARLTLSLALGNSREGD